MDKNKIKSHLHSFLVEADKKPIGKTATEKVQKKEKAVNNDYYKEVTKKMGEYDKESTGGKDSIKNDDLKKTDSGEMDVNPNGMDQIQYDNEPSDTFKQRAIDALEGTSKMGNKTYTGAENGNTEEVWGASGGKHTGKEIVKAAEDIGANLVIVGRAQKKKNIFGLPVKNVKKKMVEKCRYSILFVN